MVSIVMPVGPKPGWELDEDAGLSRIKSVEDSQVLRYSLLKSRERWLSSAFPLFSSRGRSGKPPKILPEKHVCRFLGTCELEIGVSRFPDTSVFEINFVQCPAPLLFQNTHDATPSSQSSPSVLPAITEATLLQVNALASVNPRVAELLQLAHASQATLHQLRELGNAVNSIVSASNPSPPTEMVIEFREQPGQRWVIPKEYAFSEVEVDTITIKTVLMDIHRNPEPITVKLRNNPPDIQQFVTRWLGVDDMDTRKRTWDTMAEKRDRETGFLKHQVTDGPLYAALRKANESKYTMESIDPAKARRASGARRADVDEQGPQESRVNKGKARATESGAAVEEPTPKRRKSNATGVSTTPFSNLPRRKASDSSLSCHGCGKQDMPLLRSGKFCHACIDSGVAGAAGNPSSDTIIFRLEK